MSYTVATVRREPPASLRFRRRLQYGVFLRQLWRSLGVARALTERELRARYKQAFLGVMWAFAAPLGYVVVFTIFFNRTAKIDSLGVPYPVFTYSALIAWGFLSQTMTRGSLAVMENLVLLNKVACPRETFVVAAVGTAFVDSAISTTAFPIVVLVLGAHFYATSFLLVPILVVQAMFAAGFALLVGSVLMYVRDVRHVLPLVTQLLMFATPVVWGMDALASRLSRLQILLYSLLNPMAPVCESYRRTLALGVAPDWPTVGMATVSSSVLLFVGYSVFKKLEPGFADVA